MIREVHKVIEEANSYCVFVPTTTHGNWSINNGLMLTDIFPETFDIAKDIVEQVCDVGDAFVLETTISDSNKSYSRVKSILFGVVTDGYSLKDARYFGVAAVVDKAVKYLQNNRIPEMGISLADFNLSSEEKEDLLIMLNQKYINVDLYV